MAIGWSNRQEKRVATVLDKHPVGSGRCAEAVDAILPIARERDNGARIWLLRPAEGRFVLPKVPIGQRWAYHMTVELEAHCVDALTGTPGTPRVSYGLEHWKEPDAVLWIADDGRRPL